MTFHAGEAIRSELPASFGATTPFSLGQAGSLEARLAFSQADIAQAQHLRYRCFMEERELQSPDGGRLDQDRFDPFCDHLVVVDHARGGRIVGTYRLLRHDMALFAGGFYSATYFELEAFQVRNPCMRILELGRSCVDVDYRNKRTIELMWQAIWAYCCFHHIEVMIGCASFAGTNPLAHARGLTLLAKSCPAKGKWHARAIESKWHSMMLSEPALLDEKTAFLELPPLVKGYLRVGAKVGDGCVVDRDLGTTVVLVVMPVEEISDRYRRHFSGDASSQVHA